MEWSRNRFCNVAGPVNSCRLPCARSAAASSSGRRRRGIVLAWGAIMVLAPAFNVHQLQNAADAGARARAQKVEFDMTEARQRAIAPAFQEWPENRATAGVKRLGIAWARAGGSGIICLADDPSTLPGWHHKSTGLRLSGNATVDLRGMDPATGEAVIGDIQVNATSDAASQSAVRIDGSSASMYIGELNVVGTTNPDASDTEAWARIYANSHEPFPVNTQVPRADDPLADLVPPDIGAMTPGSDTAGTQYYDPDTGMMIAVAGKPDGTVITLHPGYYPGGIATYDGTIVLEPGVYAFGGGNTPDQTSGLVVGQDASVIGTEGVMLYITGDPDGSKTGTETRYGTISLRGGGSLELISRGDVALDDALEINGETGVVLWQDRSNHNSATIASASSSLVKGTLYFGYNTVALGGTPGPMGNQIIVGAMEVRGSADLYIAYDGRNRSASHRSVLVE